MTDVPISEERLLSLASQIAKKRRIKGYEREDVEQEALVFMLQTKQDKPDVTLTELEGLTLNHLRKLYRLANHCKGEQDEDEDEETLYSKPYQAPEPLDAMISDETLEKLKEQLTEREYRVIRTLFWENGTEEDLARELGVTRKAIVQIRRRVLKRLYDTLKP